MVHGDWWCCWCVVEWNQLRRVCGPWCLPGGGADADAGWRGSIVHPVPARGTRGWLCQAGLYGHARKARLTGLARMGMCSTHDPASGVGY